MEKNLLKLLIIFVIVSLTTEQKIVCYHGSWSAQREGDGKFTTANIDPYLCTHLIYAFVGVNGDNGSVIALEPECNLGGYLELKKKNRKLKTLLAVGGWNEGSVNYSRIAGDPNLRAEFIQSALKLVKKFHFDGFDIDWEYPAQRGGVPKDKENFITLIKELVFAFHREKLVITAAVAATGSSVDISYNVPELNKHIDWLHLMTYDIHGAWDGVTGHNAPLNASSIDTSEFAKLLNVVASVEGWINRGMCPTKLVLGMPLYGRTYTLNSTDVSLGAPINGTGVAGPFTKEAGVLSYYEICLLQKTGGWQNVWDEEQKVPHMYKDNQWISYDNERSLKLKVEYAKEMKLGGVMTWAIDLDDFRGICGKTRYPLLNAIKGKDYCK